MSKKSKIEPKTSKRSRRENNAVSSGIVEPNPSKYTWLVEGDTEEAYMNSLFSHLEDSTRIRLKYEKSKPINLKGGRKEPYLDKINSYLNIPRRKFICIFDLDIVRTNESNFNKYKALIDKKKQFENTDDSDEPSVIFCTNMPSFEYWLLLHFAYTSAYYETESGIEKILKKHLPEYEKNKVANLFSKLCGSDDANLINAIKNSTKSAKESKGQRLDEVSKMKECNVSYSDMHLLFEGR
ncbi:MAG: RloB domain-containing protein [Bacteroidales bacterium]|nr:RloB domain-containing protein [Bacteroidales bacterium]